LIQAYETSYSKYILAKQAMLANPTAATISALDTALDAMTLAQNKMLDAAATASQLAKDKASQAIQKMIATNAGSGTGPTTPSQTFKGYPKR